MVGDETRRGTHRAGIKRYVGKDARSALSARTACRGVFPLIRVAGQTRAVGMPVEAEERSR